MCPARFINCIAKSYLAHLRELKQIFLDEQKTLDLELQGMKYPLNMLNSRMLKKLPQYISDPSFRHETQRFIRARSRFASLQYSIDRINSAIALRMQRGDIHSESCCLGSDLMENRVDPEIPDVTVIHQDISLRQMDRVFDGMIPSCDSLTYELCGEFMLCLYMTGAFRNLKYSDLFSGLQYLWNCSPTIERVCTIPKPRVIDRLKRLRVCVAQPDAMPIVISLFDIQYEPLTKDHLFQILQGINVGYAKHRGVQLSQRQALHFVDDTVYYDLHSESMLVSEMKDGVITTDETFENLTDVGGDDATKTFSGMQPITETINPVPVHIEKFFSRPVEIDNFDITMATDFDYSVQIWARYLENPAVRAKLKNFAFLKGKLHVRISMSGTPFDFGKVLVAYLPVNDMNPIGAWYLTHTGYRDFFLRYLSQTYGSKVMDPKDNKPLDFVFPFVSPQPMMRLFNNSSSALGDGDDFADALQRGTLVIKTLNQINSVSSSTSSKVNLNIYAWMSDVELGCPTGTVMVITSDSDERKTGPIQKLASNAATFASSISHIPYIGPYAQASAKVLSGTANLAELFGWSYPTMNNMPDRMKNEPYRNAANLTGYDLGQRIVLDPKQELTVSSNVVGIPIDELSIAHLCGIESLLSTFVWNNSDTTETAIWSTMVSPKVAVGSTPDPTVFVQPSALAYAARPFKYWRGDIKYRFEVVASNFHRGKFAVFFEPNIAQSVLINTDLDLNKQFIKVIDIQETQTFEVCVNWAYPKAWAHNMIDEDAISSVNDFTSLSSKFECTNGFIAVYPLTKLQSPDDSSIPINVYVSSENMMFNVVSQQDLPMSITAESLPMDNAIVPETCFQLNPTNVTTQHICQEHFGEMPLSFRALLKRFATTATITSSFVAQSGLSIDLPIVPLLTPSESIDLVPPNNPSLLNYLRPSFLAMRGGLRKRIHYVLTASNTNWHMSAIMLPPSATSVTSPVIISTTQAVNGNTNLDGFVQFVPHTNGGIEFELPFYSNNLYAYACTLDPFDNFDSSMDPLANRNYRLTTDFNATGTGATVYEQTAAAEDFTLMRFIASCPYNFTPSG